jgi:7-cyano-7-deazaguanine synthase
MERKLVLVSGGLDSSVLLASVVSFHGAANVVALNLYYGQKHEKEQLCAIKQTERWGVRLLQEDLSSVFTFGDCGPLLNSSHEEIPEESYAEQLDKMGGNGTVKTYVPFRNGLFLSYATAIALQIGADVIYYGAHADDAVGSAYPDCTKEFIHAMNMSIEGGTAGKVKLTAMFDNAYKHDVVRMGDALGVKFEDTWSCYNGGKKACGVCGTCLDRLAAFKHNNLVDPIEYNI